MKRYLPLYIFLFVLAISCQKESNAELHQMPDAQALINKAISLHGGSIYDFSDIRLKFRDKSYRSLRNGGDFRYERSFEEEGKGYLDVMENESFQRMVNGEAVVVADSMIRKYRNSINSVWYFALLPYKLNDPAVKKKYIGRSQIDNKAYHKIEVRFAEEGGGEDFQDVFLYFIDEESGMMDHLAYSYETDGGGLRFRKGYNFREINGLRFADYVNFKGDPTSSIQDIDKAYYEAKLDTLSLIELEDIEVKRLDL
ncbi:MAG: DUF6503 family protein [Bacteroidota bacterium]